MNRFKNILVVFDSKADYRALFDQVVDLAQRNQCALRVVSVIEEVSNVLAKPLWRETAGEIHIQEYIFKEERNSLEQFVSAIRHAGIQVNGNTIYGMLFIEIIQEVLRSHHDLVMITAEGRGGLKEMLFGNTTMHLMRKCPCPVWVIKPDQSKQNNRVLAAVDLVPDDKERMALTIKIMELASSLTRMRQSDFSLSMFGKCMVNPC